MSKRAIGSLYSTKPKKGSIARAHAITDERMTAYPYIPFGRTFRFATLADPFMAEARVYAKEHSKDDTMPTGAVIFLNGEVIGRGANGSDYHKEHGCERVRQGIKTGEGYELCEGCHPKNHSERRAIEDARQNGKDTKGATLYLWGHWWACKPCWDAMEEAGIKDVYLLSESERLFNKEDPGNIVGRQFE
jgi:deoxycytidylate deaminase